MGEKSDLESIHTASKHKVKSPSHAMRSPREQQQQQQMQQQQQFSTRTVLLAFLCGSFLPMILQQNYSHAALAVQQTVEQANFAEFGQQVLDQIHGKAQKEKQTETESVRKLQKEAPNSQQQSSSNNDKSKPLNVIIFYPDDWRHDDLHDANPHVQTPTFSEIAKDGIRFVHNYVTTSICWISRATLFTGQYVFHHESQYIFRPNFVRNKDQWKFSWPYLLQKAGYFVGHVGKWQYADKKGGNEYKNHIFNFSTYFESWIVKYNDKGKEYIADLAGHHAIRFLRERPKDKPFALTTAFYPPKGVFNTSEVKAEFLELYKGAKFREDYNLHAAVKKLPAFLQDNTTRARERYLDRYEANGTSYHNSTVAQYATLSHIDSVCGEIVKELKDQGVYDNTVIIVTADNGEFHGRHALADKWYPYDEAIRVPLIVKDPRMTKEQRGTTSDSMALNIDLAATILGAAGIKTPSAMDGRDLGDVYLSEPQSTEPWRTEMYYEFPRIDFKIPPSIALVRKDWKYLDWYQHGAEELFHTKEDPHELHDLSKDAKYAATKEEMKKRLQELRHEVYAPIVPFTKCDTLWPAGAPLPANTTDCSPFLPGICCNVTNTS